MADELEALWNHLSLGDDDEEEVVVEKAWVEESLTAMKNCLIGKLLINKSYNVEGMKTVFQKIWRLNAGLSIMEMGNQLFLFQFDDANEKDRVLVKQPWSFNKSLLVLKEFDGMQSPEEVNFDWCPFWIQIHGLPIGLMSEKIGIVIGETIREVEEVDTGNKDMGWGKALRVRVHLNVTKPFKRGRQLSIDGYSKIKVAFRYERLPEFCYVCGLLSHLENDCCEVIKLKKDGKEIHRGFASWLKADGNFSALQKVKAPILRAAGSSSTNPPSMAWGQRRKVGIERGADVEESFSNFDAVRRIISPVSMAKDFGVSNLNQEHNLGSKNQLSLNIPKQDLRTAEVSLIEQNIVDASAVEADLYGLRKGPSEHVINVINPSGSQNGPGLIEVPIFIFSQQAQSVKAPAKWKRLQNGVLRDLNTSKLLSQSSSKKKGGLVLTSQLGNKKVHDAEGVRKENEFSLAAVGISLPRQEP